VAAKAEPLASDLETLARLDLWMCKARLAEELGAVRPDAAESGTFALRSARHPGLQGRVVPIDVHLGGDFSALVITGPNTGGKTVALRTVGLLALMNQAGLHVPAAPGSALPVFRDVLADIGDEQSVAQSLSTFSGHLRTITRIVGVAGEGSLVLLDELGAGTDPTEGSALAQALLDHFIRAGSLVVATTHYAELKTYAHNESRARNASVDFDLATLAPTYRLSIGLPGTSQAFAIAERLGLPSELVDDARSRLSVAQREFESTLASIRESQRSTVAAEARTAEAEDRVRAALAEAEDERRRARAERRIAAGEARRQAEVALGAIEAEIAEMRGALARETLTEARLDQAQVRIGARLALLPGVEPVAATAADASASGVWSVGVHAATISGWEGTIAAVDAERGRATLEVGGLRVDVALDELRPSVLAGGGVPASSRGSEATTVRARPAAPRSGRRGEFGEPASTPPVARPPARGSTVSSSWKGATAPRSIASSLDLRGARVEEALELLEAYLDAAAQAEAGRVTVVHGHGSGAMRDAVRRTLGNHPLVREWRPGERGEGGDGATVVSL
jgi:DNA mismatch repair protein MutS2